jgi:hypothetical protein
MKPIQTELYTSKQKNSNEEKYGHMSNQCISCFKPMKEGESKMVHMSTDWMAMHNSIIEESDAELHNLQSQGYFPIGNSCAKKMDKEYIHQ